MEQINFSKTWSQKFLLVVINSRLLGFYYWNCIGDELSVVPNHVKELPIRQIDFSNPSQKVVHDSLASLADRMLTLHKQRNELLSKIPGDTTISFKEVNANRAAFHISMLADTKVSDFKPFLKLKIKEFVLKRDGSALVLFHQEKGEALRLTFDDEDFLKYFALIFARWIEDNSKKGFKGEFDLPSVTNLAESIKPTLAQLEKEIGADDILAIQSEIAETDKTIDKMVYELYELTPEDVAVVETLPVEEVRRKYGWH